MSGTEREREQKHKSQQSEHTLRDAGSDEERAGVGGRRDAPPRVGAQVGHPTHATYSQPWQRNLLPCRMQTRHALILLPPSRPSHALTRPHLPPDPPQAPRKAPEPAAAECSGEFLLRRTAIDLAGSSAVHPDDVCSTPSSIGAVINPPPPSAHRTAVQLTRSVAVHPAACTQASPSAAQTRCRAGDPGQAASHRYPSAAAALHRLVRPVAGQGHCDHPQRHLERASLHLAPVASAPMLTTALLPFLSLGSRALCRLMSHNRPTGPPSTSRMSHRSSMTRSRVRLALVPVPAPPAHRALRQQLRPVRIRSAPTLSTASSSPASPSHPAT